MRWLLVFLMGVLVGVAGIYFLNRENNAEPIAAAVIPAVPTAVPHAAAPASPPAEPVPPVSVAVTPPEPAVGTAPATTAAPNQTNTTTNGSTAAIPADGLLMPIAGVRRDQLINTFDQSRGDGRRHEAIDIMAPRGTPVLAVADGKVVKLFHSKAGGLTVYQFDTTEKLAYYYAHLDAYAPSMAEAKQIKRGDLVGYVGSTGNADPAAPHLHFAVFELGPEKQWWKGTAVNPYPMLVDQ